MKKVILLFLSISILGLHEISAQGGTVYGVKGGLTMATQQWDNFDRQPLLLPHGSIFIESLSEEDAFSLFAQVGYHPKGSAIRNVNLFDRNGNLFQPTYKFIFHNLALSLGAKQKFDFQRDKKVYYILGLRVDYTLDTNLDEFNEQNLRCPIFPLDAPDFIKKWNFGAIVGGGLQFPFSEYVEGFVEFTVNPDFTFQYQSPEIGNIICRNSFNQDQNYTIRERNIRNLAFEVTVGFRFLHKIEYID